ncbi:MAG: DUF2953 domain-containing protein [Methanophagales archaeon]|nr:DUF2953 domain-containing protein [Methanophagales archaeon]
MEMLLILAVVLAFILALIAATLLIPVDISLRLFKEGPLAEVRMSFVFLRGMASGRLGFSSEKREFRLRVLGGTIIKKDLTKKEEKPTDWEKLVVNANELYDAGKDFTVALTKNISMKRLEGRVKVGLSDPYQTGVLTGFLYAGSGIANAFVPVTRLEIVPSFVKEQMDTDIEIVISLPLFTIVIPAIRFFRRVKKIF